MKGVWLVVAVLAVGSGSITEPARAQSSESTARAGARKVGYEGVEAFQVGQFAAASEKLEKAYAVLRVPSLGIWSARALAKLDKLVEATDRYLEVTRLPLGGGDLEVQKRAQVDALAELETTQELTPSLVIRVQGADASSVGISVDGAPFVSQLVGEASPFNPGHHRIEGTWGDKRAFAEVTLARREQKQVTLAFAAQSAAGPASRDGTIIATSAAAGQPVADVGSAAGSKQRTIGWVVLGGGVAAVAVGGITGAIAISKRGELDKNDDCADNYLCPRELSGDVDSLNTMRLVSSVGFIAGGVLAATGAVLILTAPKPIRAAGASLWVSPTSIGLAGSF